MSRRRPILARFTLSDKVAHNDRTGGNTDARSKHLTAKCGQAAHSRCYRKRRANRALRLVLMRVWPAEICEHAIAHEFRQMATYTADLTSHCVPKAA